MPGGDGFWQPLPGGGAGTSFIPRSAEVSLATFSPASTAFQVHGPAASVPFADLASADVVVLAWHDGVCAPGSAGAVGDLGEVKLQHSFDGGATWADLCPALAAAVVSTTGFRGNGYARSGRATGTATGAVEVRVAVRDVLAANDTTWIYGSVTMLVMSQ